MKKLSNWLLGLWISFCSLLQIWTESMLYVWAMMPDDLKSALPPIVVKGVSYSIMLVGILGKMHGMRKENRRLRNDVDSR
ncbi:holin protein [Salmonella phage seszw]|nr:holin protein [Salmonella phage seszw]